MVRRSMNRNELHDQNLSLVLQQIFNNHPTSRIAISHQLNLNKSTISSLYNTLMAAGYLTELGLGEASTAGGRKPTLVEINRDYGFTLTFDLGYRHLHALATFLDGHVWKYDRIETKGQSIHEMLAQIKAYIAQRQQEDQTSHGLLGICFSIHGIVFNNQVQTSPFIDMDGIDLEQTFSAAYHVPVVLENEANLAAVYERDFNGARDLNSTVTVSIHRGIGAGIILRRDLFRGEHGDAGEIGQTVVSIAMDGAGNAHPVHAEDISSEDAIIQQIEDKKGLTNLDRAGLVQLYQDRDVDTVVVLRQFTTAIGGLIYNLMRSLDPDAFFLNSPLVEEIPDLLTQIREVYHSLAQNDLSIDVTQNARLATLLGGCSLITHRVLHLDHYELNFERPTADETD
ncbi:MAG: ROK family protein [Levilactobacillus sp.]|uniref:ROK family protein n=1 Tax=Levilactobacillus sp. TaxID=2767919 RepID=UPI002584A8D7|nr:ROK family protein [Levilactobacillus sp.]MCI1552947.1 ROK family protein [Levilactobacillus sp.]MCI1598087.1 ROK family protein [Levilactobacillus sp.]MCI1606079.1 ROK family protein [Levilactobacillus sp.]